MNNRIARKVVARARGMRSSVGVYSDATLSRAQRRVLGLKVSPFAIGSRVRVRGADSVGTIKSDSMFGTLRIELDGESTIDVDGTPFRGRYDHSSVEALS